MAIPFVALLIAMSLLLLVPTWKATIGPILDALARAADITIRLPGRLPDIHLGALASSIRDANAWVERQLGELLVKAAWPFVALLVLARKTILGAPRELAYLARDAAAAIEGLRKYVIPAMIAAKVAWIPRHLVALERQVAALAHRAPIHIVKDITNVTKVATTTIVHKAAAIPWPRIRTLEREVDALKKKAGSAVRRAPVALTAAALTAIVARTSFRWVRCSKVSRFGKSVCGMHPDYLDSLLADTLLIVGTISIVEFAKGMQDGIDEVTPQIRRFWRA